MWDVWKGSRGRLWIVSQTTCKIRLTKSRNRALTRYLALSQVIVVQLVQEGILLIPVQRFVENVPLWAPNHSIYGVEAQC